MGCPHKRGDIVFAGKDAATFVAIPDLQRPTRVEVTGEGALKCPKSVQRVTRIRRAPPEDDVDGRQPRASVHSIAITAVLSSAMCAALTVVPAPRPGSA